MGNNLTSEDLIDGGTGNDTLTFTDSNNAADDLDQVTNIETIILEDAATTITVVDSTVAADARLHINATALTAGQVLTLDLSAETNGNYKISSGADDDVITAGAGDDEFILADGNDQLAMGQNLTKDDIIDGGTGSDTLTFTDSNNAADDLDQVTNIETIILEDAATNITTKDSLVANAASLTLNAGALTATNSLIFDASAELDGNFVLTGGAGNDQVTMGQGTDQVSLGNGDDQLHFNAFLTAADIVDGGAGADTLTFTDNGQGTDELDNVLNFEAITLGDAATNLVLTDNLVAATGSFSINAQALSTGNHLVLDATAETDILSITSGGGNDQIAMGNNLTSEDLIDGGTGNDTLTFTDSNNAADDLDQVTNIETIILEDAATTITVVDSTVAADARLHINATALTAGQVLTLDLSAETNGNYKISSGADDDVITAGAGDDEFILADGDDQLAMGQNLTKDDIIDGGVGTDTLTFTDNNNAADDLDQVTNMETIILEDAATNITTKDSLVANAASLTLNAGALTATNSLIFDASAELTVTLC